MSQINIQNYEEAVLQFGNENFEELAARLYHDDMNPDSRLIRLLHAALGLADELGELAELPGLTSTDNTLEELGDVLWYCALACRAIGRSFAELAQGQPREAFSLFMLAKHTGSIASEAKRAIFYGTALKLDRVEFALACIIPAVLVYARGLNWYPRVLQANYDKLATRYGDKFSAQRATQRDLGLEAEAIRASENQVK